MADFTESPEERALRRKQEKLNAGILRQRDQVLINILSLPAGRDWFYDILARCHVFHEPFVSGAPDSTAYNCGQQNIGRSLMADIVRVAPDAYIQMLQEQTNGGRTSGDPSGNGTGSYTSTDDDGDLAEADQPSG